MMTEFAEIFDNVIHCHWKKLQAISANMNVK